MINLSTQTTLIINWAWWAHMPGPSNSTPILHFNPNPPNFFKRIQTKSQQKSQKGQKAQETQIMMGEFNRYNVVLRTNIHQEGNL